LFNPFFSKPEYGAENELAAVLSHSFEWRQRFLKTKLEPSKAPVYVFDDNPDVKSNSCPFAVPKALQEPLRAKLPKRPERVSPAQKFPELFSQALHNTISDEVLLFSYERQLDRAPILAIDWDDDTKRFVLGMVRGDNRYASRLRSRVEAACSALADLPGTALFHTCTIDPKPYGNNRIAANTAFKDEVLKYKRRLKKYRSIKYVSIVEAQENGDLHLHTLIKFVDQTVKHYIDPHGRWRVQDKQIKNRMASFWPMGLCDLQVIRNEHVSTYIIKYISKGFVKKDLDPLKKKDGLSPEDKKGLLSLLMPVLVQCRLFHCSHGLTVTRNQKKEGRLLEVAESVKQRLAEATERELSEIALIRHLNNLTSQCRCHAWLLGNTRQKSGFLDLVGTVAPSDYPLWLDFREVSIPLGCPGCVFTQMTDDFTRKLCSNKK
jgi:glycerol-3-phosphate cytidylyltransferase-like family protein